MLILKLFLVPTYIAFVALCGRLWGATVAGLLSGLPGISGPILWFIYIENGLDFAQGAAVASVIGTVALSSFCFAYSWFATKFSWKYSIIFSSISYFFIALLIGKLNVGIHLSALISLVVIFMQIYFSPKLENKVLLAPTSNAEIICRMVFAFCLVMCITKYSAVLGKTYSGIFAVFPVAGSTLAIFSHRNYSANHAIQSLKSMKLGLLSMLAFFYIIAANANSMGFNQSLLLATIIAILIQGTILYSKYSRKNRINTKDTLSS